MPSPINNCRATTRPQIVKLGFVGEETHLLAPWRYTHSGTHITVGDKYSEGDAVESLSILLIGQLSVSLGLTHLFCQVFSDWPETFQKVESMTYFLRKLRPQIQILFHSPSKVLANIEHYVFLFIYMFNGCTAN